MTRQAAVKWKLRSLLAEKGMFKTTDLHRALKELGIELSREQVYRLVTTTPQRLNIDVFAGICLVLECSPNDIIEVEYEETHTVRAQRASGSGKLPPHISPVRAKVSRPHDTSR